ncbi:C39 family peptidase [Gordonibacter sp.]|uniref:C39 family peptidase n=1 Tax=Gordonibacter sp. TaxID=1968902 RepID=UPI002FC96A63
MKDNARRRAGGVEVWAYHRGMLGRANVVRAVVVVACAVLVVVAVFAFLRPGEASGAVEHAVAEEIVRIDANAHVGTNVETGVEVASGEALSLPRSVQLDVPSYAQNPLLPTGCESVALTDVLAYRGFDLATTDIADTWLPLSETDFVNAFMGDPYRVEGNSCMAPCIAQTASAFLAAQGSALVAYDATDMTVEVVLQTVASGVPVVAWCTIDLVDPGVPYAVARQDDRVYELYDVSHCVVVSGYDLNESVVYVSDPLEGQVTYDLALFASRYYELGAQAVVVA